VNDIDDDALMLAEDGDEPGLGWRIRETITHQLSQQISDQIDLDQLKKLPETQRREQLRVVASRLLANAYPDISPQDFHSLVAEILDELIGLGPIDRVMRDYPGGDIVINGPYEIWVEQEAQLDVVPVRFRDAQHLMNIIERIVSRVGRRIDEQSPMVDARLPDGSRLNVIIPPLSLKGPALSIRRFSAKPLTVERLIDFGALTPEMTHLLRAAVQGKLNIIVSGGTGSGKTTLLNCLSSWIPENERVITIEDAAELQLQQRHVLPLETRPANLDGKNEITMRDLLRNALRMRPDRILVGECRGVEALDMLQAMNTGHDGSLTTLHANSPRDALTRLETLLLMAGFDIPLKALRRQIASAVQLIVQAERLAGGPRKVTSITEVIGMEGDVIVTQEIFLFEQLAVDTKGVARGQFIATGVRPKFAVKLEAAGFPFPPHLFTRRILGKA
jgi:pilus assembly protein CpaF